MNRKTFNSVGGGGIGRGIVTVSRSNRFFTSQFKQHLPPYLLVLPALTLIGMLLACLVSLFVQSMHGQSESALGFTQYQLLAEDPTYRGYILTSFRVAFAATIGCLFVGYPLAYYMVTTGPKLRNAITMFLVLLFFSDYVMRVYSLILLMGNNGLFNRTLIYVGFTQGPIRLLYSETGVVIGLVLGNVPFMIFAISTVMGRLDQRLLQAAALLGASPWAIWRRIVLPLSIPGIVSGATIVFLLSMNSYLTPALLGGGFVQMISNFIYDQAISLWNMPLAAAGSVIVLSSAFIIIGIVNGGFERLGRRVGLAGGQR